MVIIIIIADIINYIATLPFLIPTSILISYHFVV